MKTIIPKDCIICDLCNKPCSDGDFIATCDSSWYEGWLYCDECIIKYPQGTGGRLIMKIYKGDPLSHTDLARPIEIEGFD